ncbi:helix-turn-helix domain-containing protein [Alteromonas ponticola]|nr:XRE family transcriptional regulator [Alteromonas ponticola]
MNENIAEYIAKNLKARRQEKGWSLDSTAKATGVSKAMLGQIEREESSPTIATLWKIATGLNCSFSSLLDQGSASPHQHNFKDDVSMAVETLFPFSPVTSFEVFAITLSDHHRQLSPAHSNGVTEHIHVLSGELAVLSDGQWRSISENQQFVLAADQPHGYEAKSGTCKFIDVIHYPQ